MCVYVCIYIDIILTLIYDNKIFKEWLKRLEIGEKILLKSNKKTEMKHKREKTRNARVNYIFYQ